MRVFTIISKSGDAWCLARRIKDEGHRALVYINDSSKRDVGNGIVEKSQVQRELIDKNGNIDNEVLKEVLYPKPDCVIFDMVGEGFGKCADLIKKAGIAVIGGSSWADLIELDRPYGAKVMKSMGISIPKTYSFTDYDKAIAFVEDKKQAFVYKPSGNQATSTTYVSKGWQDMIGMLDYYRDIKEEFELQEKIDGVEVSTELWFNGEEVITVNHTFEEKSLLPKGLGPKAGCMGSAVVIGSIESKLFKEGVGKLIPALKKIKYRGPIDLNTIVTKDKVYGLEFTARFGYDALFILMEMLKGKVNDFLYGVATGALRKVDFLSEWGLGIDMSVPPYPMDVEPCLYKGVLIQGINKFNLKHLWLYDCMRKENKYLCSGNGGDIGTITARGDRVETYHPIRDAKRRVLRTIRNLVIPDVMYREDIGDRVYHDYPQLKDWGWI